MFLVKFIRFISSVHAGTLSGFSLYWNILHERSNADLTIELSISVMNNAWTDEGAEKHDHGNKLLSLEKKPLLFNMNIFDYVVRLQNPPNSRLSNTRTKFQLKAQSIDLVTIRYIRRMVYL